MTAGRRLYVIEGVRRRIVASAPDAGQARTIAAMLLLGSPHALERDALVVREPEDEECAAFEASRPGPGSDVDLGAIPL